MPSVFEFAIAWVRRNILGGVCGIELWEQFAQGLKHNELKRPSAGTGRER
jgi:hypothetical protein